MRASPRPIPASFRSRVDRLHLQSRPTTIRDIDSAFYVTAHEVAHMWWGHQVVSGDVQGATCSPSPRQYSALMVMKHE